MDIDLLSKMVKEMILDNDSVTLPGVGSFVAEVVPATFSDKGYTINPPYRRLFFRQRHDEDTRLLDFYCRTNDVDPADGERILTEFLTGLKEILVEKKIIILPGLGRLRATKENNFFFVPDEDLDIYPEGFGLEPVSLKTHQETEEEVSAARADLKSIIDDPAEEPAIDISLDEDIDTPVEDTTAETAAEEPFAEEVPVEETPEEVPVEAPVEETPEEVPVEASMEETPVEVAATEEVPVEETPEDVPAEETPMEVPPVEIPVKKRNPWVTVAIILGALLLAVVLFLLIFVILAKVNPEFIDTILYTPEELRILNY